MSKVVGVIHAMSKEAVVREWVSRQLGGVEHELRVARVARALFELTAEWHGLGREESEMLGLACLVHDVGRAVVDKGHAEVGARMVMDNLGLPLDESGRRRMAYLTRYHRGKVAEIGEEEFLLEGADAGLRTVLGFLRAADALDSRTLGGPQIVVTKRRRVVSVFGYIAGGDARALGKLGRAKKLKLLEEMLGCEIRTQWHRTDVVAMVS